MTRELGLTDKYSLVRHLIGTPALPTVGFTVSIPESTKFKQHVLTAVVKAAVKLPSAFTRCADVKTSAPSFELVPEVDMEKMVIWDTTSARTEDAVLKVFETDLGIETGSLPIWRVIVWHQPETSEAWIGVIGGHMIFDGLSIADFATSIINHLGSEELSKYTIKRPADLGKLPASLESLINTKPSTTALLSIVFKELVVPKLPTFLGAWFPKPNYWVGNTDRPSPPVPAVTHLEIEASIVQRLQQVCKSKGVTLHCLLHAAIAQTLTPLAAASRKDIRSSTPMSFRRWLPGSPVQGNYSGGGYFMCTETNDLWQSAAAYQSWLRSDIPKQEGLQSYGLLAHVPKIGDGTTSESWEAFFRPKISEPHNASFEINNLGKATITSSGANGWDVQDVVFSVRPLPNYSALVFAFATLEKNGTTGPMTLSLTREAHVITDGETAKIISQLDAILRLLVA